MQDFSKEEFSLLNSGCNDKDSTSLAEHDQTATLVDHHPHHHHHHHHHIRLSKTNSADRIETDPSKLEESTDLFAWTANKINSSLL
jgi:hypothetical protein